MTTKGERLFTEVELKEMGVETINLIDQAIDAGDLEKTKKLAHRMHKEFFTQHEDLRDWIASLLSFVERRLGDEAVYEAVHETFSQFSPLFVAYHSQDIRRKVQMLAAGFRGHLTSLAIEEDDEKFTLMMTPCGSGGRAIRNNSYSPPKNFAKIKKPHKMTYGRADFPVYCAHCAIQDILPMEMTGYPVWVIDVPEKVGEEPCRYHIYKDPDKIPEKYYQRYGLKKPTPKSKTE